MVVAAGRSAPGPDGGPSAPGLLSRTPLVLLLLATVAAGALLFVIADGGSSGGEITAPPEAGPFRGNRLPDGLRGKPAPDFELADARGGSLDTRELAGRPYAVTFLFTDCPDVCPLIGQELGQALELLGPRAGQVAVVAVSVDPVGDTPAAVLEWLRRHRLPRNFHYLIGARDELQPVWASYYVAPQQLGVRESLHTASIWLIDRRGRWRTKFSAGVPIPPRDIAHDLEVLLREPAA
jgi:protein SCO1/2